jgi:hypothetical protein
MITKKIRKADKNRISIIRKEQFNISADSSTFESPG